MISQLNNSGLRNAVSGNLDEPKVLKQTTILANAKLTNSNRIEQLKESIDSGKYKVDLSALSQKMAQELL